ncbi:MAG: alanine-zipper protein [Calothrix sp. MO_167.B12]|nr:alanine-zipper protein [Calothrix sp. MO_167.B12]
MSVSSVISNLQSASNCAGKCNCCANLQQQINQLKQQIQSIKPVDEQAIINKSTAAAQLGLTPLIGTIVAQKLLPINNKLLTLSNTATGALNLAQGATITAGSALSKYAGIASKVAGVAALVTSVAGSIAVLKVSGARIDGVEKSLDLVNSDLSRLFGLNLTTKRIASRADTKSNIALTNSKTAFDRTFVVGRVARTALSKAEKADEKAVKASQAAKNADEKAVKALNGVDAVEAITKFLKNQINNVSSVANSALSTANQAASTANQATSTANQATSTANQATSTANQATSTANQATSTANQATSTANQAASTASTASATAAQARAAASTASATAAQARAAANIATAIATQAKSAADAALNAIGFTSTQIKTTVVRVTRTETIAKRAENTANNSRRIVQTRTVGGGGLSRTAENKINQIEQSVNTLPAALAGSAVFTAAVTSAAAKGTCQSAQPGGCLGSKFQRLEGKVDGLGNVINGAGIAGLSAQINGLQALMTAKFAATWSFLTADRTLNVLSAIGTLHNAYMLSGSLSQTLFSIVDNVGGILFKDANGESFSTSKVLGQTFENWAKGLFGVTTWEGIKANWKKFNRIYQAGANIVNSVRSMMDSVRNVSEFIAENTGRIGNALKRYAVIGEDAFKWMPEKVDGRSIWLQRLENIEEAASGIEMITGEVLNITQNVNEIQQQAETFKKSISDSLTQEQTQNKSVNDRESTNKTQSQSPVIPESAERNP